MKSEKCVQIPRRREGGGEKVPYQEGGEVIVHNTRKNLNNHVHKATHSTAGGAGQTWGGKVRKGKRP